MVVIAIIGILAAVAYPAYTEYVVKAKRADGIDGLVSLAGRMEEFYMNNDTYKLATINAAGTGTVGSDQTSADRYTLIIAEQDDFYYKLQAKPKLADAECGSLELDSLGAKTIVGGAAANPDDCW
ncbi:MAG: pilus assembly protein PilE [Gammaproteobacteria bacterium]|nr:pilus assembly protein PilE [Gammaproteobacteria bacterium]